MFAIIGLGSAGFASLSKRNAEESTHHPGDEICAEAQREEAKWKC
jgi:hypothetical protein